jgi:cold shock CspA family protein
MSVNNKSGYVKMLSPSFGFLTSDSGDVYISAKVWEQAGIALQKGDKVTFTAESSPRGPRAISIALAD